MVDSGFVAIPLVYQTAHKTSVQTARNRRSKVSQLLKLSRSLYPPAPASQQRAPAVIARRVAPRCFIAPRSPPSREKVPSGHVSGVFVVHTGGIVCLK